MLPWVTYIDADIEASSSKSFTDWEIIILLPVSLTPIGNEIGIFLFAGFN